MDRGHEFLEHTSETVVRVRAPSLAALLEEAGRALAELELRGRSAPVTGPWREVTLRSSDRAALLVDWLNELLFIAERERLVPAEFEVQEADAGYVRARVRGVRLAEPPAFVKAATMGALSLKEADGTLVAEVTLDV